MTPTDGGLPVLAMGERLGSKSMRQYIKSWITEWDIERLFGESARIDVETIEIDYGESAALEQAPSARDAEEE